ncbi:hypothetical protein HA466_0134630 [Hirschfeldia incana]|nr:hypothetical protein HA466_0134630 [Hirschfeldia incana]KAJ0251073.1 hypothetical protein HA466_0134630 [Hirschfeldia incana]
MSQWSIWFLVFNIRTANFATQRNLIAKEFVLRTPHQKGLKIFQIKTISNAEPFINFQILLGKFSDLNNPAATSLIVIHFLIDPKSDPAAEPCPGGARDPTRIADLIVVDDGEEKCP